MSATIAAAIRSETGHAVEWAPANQEYVIWPEGIPCQTAEETRAIIAELASQPVEVC